ncbi:MAG TPA: hypothetical protein VMZ53_25785, partial [Kofleriaceae bacterium]|nr:hypothetical protein [Kofleriaceae bacterium]
FSAVALGKNYELLKNEFMALEFPDARRGRAVAKAILVDDYRIPNQVGGIAHRGGSVLETPGSNGSDPALCPTWAGMTPPANVTPFCVIQEWVNRERASLGNQVTQMNQSDTVPVIFVERNTGDVRDRLEFDTFVGGADLMRATLTFGANFGGNPTVGGATSLLGNASCAGLAGGDIQAPDVAPDGDRVAFAARPSAGAPLSVWIVQLSTGQCTQVTPASGMIHNFDPAFSPDGRYLVFASTRGKSGPTQSRKRLLPQSDLWRIQLPTGTPEQMTFLSNSEVSPQFMREGRVTMTTEKASDGFYQLAGRRLNWDLTDYHPLLAQRSASPYASLTDLAQSGPSIGYSAATDIREGADGNFLLILSDVGTDGKSVVPGAGGALAVFNRSIGPFEQGRGDPGYLPSVKFVDSAATGRMGATTAYRAPTYLPDGQILVSYAPQATTANYRLVAMNPRTGAQTTLLNPPGGKAIVDAVIAYAYPPRSLYLNRRQLVFGGTSTSDPTHSVLYMPDAPMIFTLLTGNLRRGRPVTSFRTAAKLVVETEGMCPAGSCTRGANGIFESRMTLGSADLADDGSVKVRLPAGVGVILSLVDSTGKTLVKMGEEHQLGPGEQVSMGVRETITNAAGQTVNLFDAICAGCHGSVSGRELDVSVSADALTGASASASQTADPTTIGN